MNTLVRSGLVAILVACGGNRDSDTGGTDDTATDDTSDSDTGGDSDSGDSDSDTGGDSDSADTDSGDTDTGDTGDTADTADTGPKFDGLPFDDGGASYRVDLDGQTVCRSSYSLSGEEYTNSFCDNCDFMYTVASTEVSRHDTPLCTNRDPWRYTFAVPYPAAFPDDQAGFGYVAGYWYSAGYGYLPIEKMFFSFYESGGTLYGYRILSGTVYPGASNETTFPGTFTSDQGDFAWTYDPAASHRPDVALIRNCSDRIDPANGTFLNGVALIPADGAGNAIVGAATSINGAVSCEPTERADTYTVSLDAEGPLRVSIDVTSTTNRMDPLMWVNDAWGCTIAVGDDQFACTSGLCNGGATGTTDDYACCASVGLSTVPSGTYTIYVMAHPSGVAACSNTSTRIGNYSLKVQGATPQLSGNDLRPDYVIHAEGGVPYDPTAHRASLDEGTATWTLKVDGSPVCQSTYALTGQEYANTECVNCEFMFSVDSTEATRSDTTACPIRDPWQYTLSVPYPAAYPDDQPGLGYVAGRLYSDGYGYLDLSKAFFTFYGAADVIYGFSVLSGTWYGGTPDEFEVPGTFTNDQGDIEWSYGPDSVFAPRAALVRNCSDRDDQALGTYLGAVAVVPPAGAGNVITGDDTPTTTTGSVSCASGEYVDVYTIDHSVEGDLEVSVDAPDSDHPMDAVAWINDAEGCTVAMADDQFECTAGPCAAADTDTANDYACCGSVALPAAPAGVYTLYVMGHDLGTDSCTASDGVGNYSIAVVGGTAVAAEDEKHPSFELDASGTGTITY